MPRADPEMAPGKNHGPFRRSAQLMFPGPLPPCGEHSGLTTSGQTFHEKTHCRDRAARGDFFILWPARATIEKLAGNARALEGFDIQERSICGGICGGAGGTGISGSPTRALVAASAPLGPLRAKTDAHWRARAILEPPRAQTDPIAPLLPPASGPDGRPPLAEAGGPPRPHRATKWARLFLQDGSSYEEEGTARPVGARPRKTRRDKT